MQLSCRNILLLALSVLATTNPCFAFCPPSSSSRTTSIVSSQQQQQFAVTASPTRRTTSSTSLSERRWNFNEGQSPWGLKKNAEIWNGRLAQVSIITLSYVLRYPQYLSYTFTLVTTLDEDEIISKDSQTSQSREPETRRTQRSPPPSKQRLRRATQHVASNGTIA